VSLWVRLILVVLLALLQYQLWLGRDGLLHRQRLDARLNEIIQRNEALAARISRTHKLMAEQGIETSRLRLCAICTVCSKAFLKEVRQMNELLTAGSAAAAAG